MYFTFDHDFINCMFATVTDVVKNSPAVGFSRSCISISFTIPFIICVQTMTNAVRKFACGGLSVLLYLNFDNLNLAPKFIPAYITARDCTIGIHEPLRGVSRRFYSPWGIKNVLT